MSNTATKANAKKRQCGEHHEKLSAEREPQAIQKIPTIKLVFSKRYSTRSSGKKRIDRLEEEEHTPQIVSDQKKFSPAQFNKQIREIEAHSKRKSSRSGASQKRVKVPKGKRQAREWGFEPDARYECLEEGMGIVRSVGKGNKLRVDFDNGTTKYFSKKQAERLFRSTGGRLTRTMRKKRECHFKKNSKPKTKKTRKRSATSEDPELEKLLRSFQRPRCTRSNTKRRSECQTNSGRDYQHVRSLGDDLQVIRTNKGNFQPEAKPGKFKAYTLGSGVEVKRTTLPKTSRRNRGLFTTVNIKKNHLITEYNGIPINRERAMSLRKEGKATHIKGLNYDLFLDGNRWPKLGQGAAQMANDAKDSKKNNSKFVVKFDSSVGREVCFLKALRDIEAGEEIFVSYGKGYWNTGISF